MKARCLTLVFFTLMIVSVGLTLNTEVSEAVPIQESQPEALARKRHCFECHDIDKNVVGPAYRDVAMKYKDDARAREALIQKVKKGGKGNWKASNGVPMPAFERLLSDAEIARLVDWVLSLQNPQ